MNMNGLLRVTAFVSWMLWQCPAAAQDRPPVLAPALITDHDEINALYDLAVKTVTMNVHRDKRGLMEKPGPILHAGKSYPDTWTRDASYNTWFAAGLIAPEVARNSLLCEVMNDDQYGVRIGSQDWYGNGRMRGQYWDAIVWVTGAWSYYCTTGDEEFLKLAYRISKNSIRYFEDTEYDRELGLFNGPAGLSDGVAGYPMPYSDAGGSSFILDTRARVNGKFVMKALSTNCLYVSAYDVLAKMAGHFGENDSVYSRKAGILRKAINDKLWMEEKGRYAYFLDMNGMKDDHMEALGHSFVILFDIAQKERVEKVLRNQFRAPYGIPCLWPVFPEFGNDFGRHNGTIWPMAQGVWAWACAVARDEDRFASEFANLTRLAAGSNDFREIYHPINGTPYGGWQVGKLWESEPSQSWSATAYLSMVYHCIFGMRFSEDGLRFDPILPKGITSAKLENLKYRNMILDIELKGSGKMISGFKVDGKECQPYMVNSLKGRHTVEILMKGVNNNEK